MIQIWVVKPIPTSAHRITSSPRVYCSTASAVHHRRFVGFVLFSWWWAWWCPKHVETPINTSSFLHLVVYLFTFKINFIPSLSKIKKSHGIRVNILTSLWTLGLFSLYFYLQLKSHFDRIERGMGNIKHAYRIFVEKFEGKTAPLSRRWEDNMKTDLR
jgi:hypothetical protein